MRHTLLLGSICGLLIATGFAACKLDLDESLIQSADGGPDAAAGGSAGWGSGGTSGVGGFSAAPGDGGPCDADNQCAVEGGGCLEGHCISGSCSYGICPSAAACEGRSCDFSSNTCGASTPVGFKAQQLDVGAELGCGGVAQRCIATVGDYVVVGSQSTLLAWHVVNPLSPVQVNVEAPPFAISRLVSNANRLLIVGVSGGGKLSVAWIDAPASSAPTNLQSKAAAVNYSGGLSAAYPADNDDFFLVHDDAAQFFPTARLDLPIDTGASVTLYPNTGIPAGETIVAASGSRLIGYHTDTSGAAWVPSFSLETQAGTNGAQNAGSQGFTVEAPPSLGAHVFTSAHEGSLLWSTNRIVRADGSTYSDAVVLRWVLIGTGDAFDPTPEAVLETYPSYGTDELRAGPSAAIDANTAIATAAYPADTSQSTVRGVIRSGTTASVTADSDVVPFAKTALGVVATRRFGIVVTPSTTTAPDPPNTALRIYAPNCKN